MLDAKYLRDNLDEVKQLLQKKRYELDLEAFKFLDAKRKQSDIETQQLLSERKKASKQIGELVRNGTPVDEAKQTVNDTLKEIDARLDDLKNESRQVQHDFQELLMHIPNTPDDCVPEGADECANREVFTWGKPRNFDFEIKDHIDLGAVKHELDFDLASKLTGSRFTVMRGQMAAMHRALTQFMLNTHINEHGYQEIYVPYMVNSESLRGTGQLPKFEEDLFKLEGESNYYLIPTAEVPVTNILRDTIVDNNDKRGFDKLPLKFTCHSPCFRSEAGSYGRDVRGLIRQHQFEKVELVQMVHPDDSAQALEELTGHAEAILQKLELPYRKVILCGGDLSFSAKRTYDLEVWLPGQDAYREISSCSSFGDYQARRMKARFRNPETGKPELIHTLNGSGLAVGRTLVAVLENHQNADGSITVPEVLRPLMGGVEKINC